MGAEIFGVSGPGQSANAFRICSSFLRPDTWNRQSGKLLPLMMAKAAAAAAAIVIDAMRLHLAKLRAESAENLPLRLDHTHQPHHVAGSWRVTGKSLRRGIKFDFAAENDVAQQRKIALARDVKVAG